MEMTFCFSRYYHNLLNLARGMASEVNQRHSGEFLFDLLVYFSFLRLEFAIGSHISRVSKSRFSSTLFFGICWLNYDVQNFSVSFKSLLVISRLLAHHVHVKLHFCFD